MKVHVFSDKLEVIELFSADEAEHELISEKVRADRIKMGVAPWPSIRLELYTYRQGRLIFATPAESKPPKFPLELEGD